MPSNHPEMDSRHHKALYASKSVLLGFPYSIGPIPSIPPFYGHFTNLARCIYTPHNSTHSLFLSQKSQHIALRMKLLFVELIKLSTICHHDCHYHRHHHQHCYHHIKNHHHSCCHLHLLNGVPPRSNGEGVPQLLPKLVSPHADPGTQISSIFFQTFPNG